MKKTKPATKANDNKEFSIGARIVFIVLGLILFFGGLFALRSGVYLQMVEPMKGFFLEQGMGKYAESAAETGAMVTDVVSAVGGFLILMLGIYKD